mmetsp:Transcript_29747/g.63713  ORF Transcript_29747/g.63713 Transcript_29747/m.63713 type:complete len:320 (+) Transcript_29747:76-1035(+)
MLPKSNASSMKFSRSPAFVASPIHYGDFLYIRPKELNKITSMRQSCFQGTPTTSRSVHYPFTNCVDNGGSASLLQFGSAIVIRSRRSRKQTRTSLQLAGQRDQKNDRNNSNNKNAERRRNPVKVSLFDKLVDKALLIDAEDDSSLESPFPTTLILLGTIITSLVIPNTLSRVSFLGFFLIFSFLAVYPSRVLWDDDSEDFSTDTSKNLYCIDDEDNDNSRIGTFTLVYVASLLLTWILTPLDFEMVEVMPATDSSYLVTIAIVSTILLGLFSNFGFIESQNRAFEANDSEDFGALSAEKQLMDIWDEQYKREESDGRHD